MAVTLDDSELEEVIAGIVDAIELTYGRRIAEIERRLGASPEKAWPGAATAFKLGPHYQRDALVAHAGRMWRARHAGRHGQPGLVDAWVPVDDTEAR